MIEKNIEKKVYKISEIFHDIDTRFILLNKLNIKTNNHNLNFYKLNNRRIDNLNFFNINTVNDYNYFIKICDLQIFSNQKFSKQVISNFNGDSTNLFCEKWKYFFIAVTLFFVKIPSYKLIFLCNKNNN